MNRRRDHLLAIHLGVAAIVLVGYLLNDYWSDAHPRNFLYEVQGSFTNPRLENATSDLPKTFLFGSSNVSGSDVPADSTIADQLNAIAGDQMNALNFGLWGANVLTSFALYDAVSRRYEPRYVVLGLSPDDFVRPREYHPLAVFKRRELRAYLPEATYDSLNRPAARFSAVVMSFLLALKPYVRTYAQLRVSDALLRLQTRIYGTTFSGYGPYDVDPALSKEAFLDPLPLTILRNFADLASRRGEKLMIYFSPIYDPEHTYPAGAVKAWRKQLRDFLEAHGISYADLTDTLPWDNRHFADSVHPSPLGNQIIAARLRERFQELGWGATSR